MRLLPICLGAIVITTISACSLLPSNSSSTLREQPSWVTNPSSAGKIVGLGSAKSHIKGPAAQRALAMSRALDEIAKQKGVSVSNIVTTQGSMSATRASSSLQTVSQQVVNNNQVHAVIKDEWNSGDELFILMVAE